MGNEAAEKRAAEIPEMISKFCKSNLGKQVGNGECWTLADEAFKACGLKRPGADMRVWGRMVDHKKEKHSQEACLTVIHLPDLKSCG